MSLSNISKNDPDELATGVRMNKGSSAVRRPRFVEAGQESDTDLWRYRHVLPSGERGNWNYECADNPTDYLESRFGLGTVEVQHLTGESRHGTTGPRHRP